ncbi:MAG: ABC transporter ATP-binding protein [Desulfobacterales bacterium]|nr:ABC transporter ATP-binding protein [Desulfobacterales bacterium]
MELKTVIETKELTKIYNTQIAVDRLTFKVYESEIFGFLGPNGAGKTTTLLMILGLTEPTTGTVQVLDVNPVREPLKVKRFIGYLPENMGFYRDLNAWESLRFVAELNGLPRQVAEERIVDALRCVDMLKDANKKIEAYSRGMRQRLGIAEVLVKNPKIAFLDEPTLGLDPDATNRMMGLIKELSKEKHMTVLLSSHLLHQAQKICDRVGIMINGRMVAQGAMDQLAEEKLGVGKETYTLEEIYMKYFQEA